MRAILTLLMFGFCLYVHGQKLADFENFAIAPDSFLNGNDNSGGFISGDIFLPNDYNPEFQSWSGWAISNIKDTLTPGFMNQYSAIPGKGVDSSDTYAVSFSFGPNQINLQSDSSSSEIIGLYITNSTYAYLSMLEGDAFSKKFGGVDGNDPDFFLLTIKGIKDSIVTEDSIDVYLADFRFDDNSQDYILKSWEYVDLSMFGVVDGIQFQLSSSDVGSFGMNTPAYFCMDNVETSGIPTSIFSSIQPNLNMNAYPNPFTDQIQLSVEGLQQGEGYIIDMQGRLMKQFTLAGSSKSLDLSQLPTGTYFIKVRHSKGIASKMITKFE